jgi:ABC-2 type transport system permease protein
MTIGTILPSVFLSGYVFPLDSMPAGFRWLSNLVPATWLIDASRSVILRGGDWTDLWKHALVLWAMAVGFLLVGAARFRKQVA